MTDQLTQSIFSVYLLHFDRPFSHARHYVGVTGKPLEERLAAHRGAVLHDGDRSYGRQPKLLQAAQAAGITWSVADVWEFASKAEAYGMERRLKRQGGHGRKCSICRPGNTRGDGRGKWPRKREA